MHAYIHTYIHISYYTIPMYIYILRPYMYGFSMDYKPTYWVGCTKDAKKSRHQEVRCQPTFWASPWPEKRTQRTRWGWWWPFNPGPLRGVHLYVDIYIYIMYVCMWYTYEPLSKLIVFSWLAKIGCHFWGGPIHGLAKRGKEEGRKRNGKGKGKGKDRKRKGKGKKEGRKRIGKRKGKGLGRGKEKERKRKGKESKRKGKGLGGGKEKERKRKGKGHEEKRKRNGKEKEKGREKGEKRKGGKE